MILNREKGGYLMGAVVRLCGSFRIDGTSNPDVIRDGNSNCIESVTRESAGLFTVLFRGATTPAEAFPLPTRPVSVIVNIAQAASPTAAVDARLVRDSYSAVTRTFQVQCLDYETPAATDPDDNDLISFELVGAIDSAGEDAA